MFTWENSNIFFRGILKSHFLEIKCKSQIFCYWESASKEIHTLVALNSCFVSFVGGVISQIEMMEIERKEPMA